MSAGECQNLVERSYRLNKIKFTPFSGSEKVWIESYNFSEAELCVATCFDEGNNKKKNASGEKELDEYLVNED